MFDRYRGLIFFIVFVSFVAYMGFRDSKNISLTVQKSVDAAMSKIESTNSSDVISSTEFKAKVEEIVHSAIKHNDAVREIITSEVQSAISDIAQEQNLDQLIQENKNKIYDLTSPSIGNATSENVIVLFVDYNCGYCKESAKAIENIITNGQEIKVIFKALPVLGANSAYLAKISTAVFLSDPLKYEALNYKFFAETPSTKEEIDALLQEYNLNVTSITQLAESPEVNKIITDNALLAKTLHIKGVPVFIIHEKYYRGYMSVDNLLDILMNTKKPYSVNEVDSKDGTKEQNNESHTSSKSGENEDVGNTTENHQDL